MQLSTYVIHCDSCGWVVIGGDDSRNRFDYTCPRCHGLIHTLQCTRCGNVWAPRSFDQLPRYCPSCKSPYWNKTRVRETKERQQDDGFGFKG